MKLLIPCLKKLSAFREEDHREEGEEMANLQLGASVLPEELKKEGGEKDLHSEKLNEEDNTLYGKQSSGLNDVTGSKLFEEDKLEHGLKTI